MEANITVCLLKPEAPQDPRRVAVMRQAIEQDGAREGSLASECLTAARAHGLSSEDTYVFLAYQALFRLAETNQRHVYLSDIAPFIEQALATRDAGARFAASMRRLVRRVLTRRSSGTGPAGRSIDGEPLRLDLLAGGLLRRLIAPICTVSRFIVRGRGTNFWSKLNAG
jgi:hypothetical protein